MKQKQFPTRFWNKQIRRATIILNVMRVVLLLVLLVFLMIMQLTHTIPQDVAWVAYQNARLLYFWWVLYAMLAVFSYLNPSWQHQQRKNYMPDITSVVDISMIMWLVYLLGGVGTGLGVLVLPFLAIACLLNYGQYPLIYAAYATLWVLYEIFLKYYLQRTNFLAEDSLLLFNQVALIASFFVVSLLTSFLVTYAVQADDDIEESQQAYARVDLLNKIVMNRMQEAAVVVDRKRRIWLFNRKALQYFPFLRVGDSARFLFEIINHWRNNVYQHFETTCQLHGKNVHVRAIPLVREREQFLTLFFRLEQERQIEAQTVKLASLGQLTANLAHEIRNPLSAMRQANGLLLETEEGNKMTEKLCRIIENNIARIDRMIEEVSLLNKKDRVNRERIDLEQLLEDFRQEFVLTKLNIKGSGCFKIILPISARLYVFFDSYHLLQILWNLCNNGWRYCSKTRSSLVIYVREKDENYISLQVWDDGEGVSPENQSKLFEPFFTTQKQSDGTGLGLYVARELAHANKGDLRYLGKEKVFELILPKVENDKS